MKNLNQNYRNCEKNSILNKLSTEEGILVTTPLFYASGDPHIGHAYTLVIGDLIKRYHKLIGIESYLLTGTDEHGEKILNNSKKEGLRPEEFVSLNSSKFQKLHSQLEISADFFVRTTDENHKEYVKEFFIDLIDKNLVYKSTWSGAKCINCETNYSFRYYTRNKFCELGHSLQEKEEEGYFLKASKFSNFLKKHYDNKDIISPIHILSSIKNSFLSNLEDLSITRQKLEWGIELPDQYSDFTVYVWIEALMGYFSDSKIRQKWSTCKIIQVVGKEIVRFHSIYLPIILKIKNLKMPDKLIAHGWLTSKEEKISKSTIKEANILSLENLLKKYSIGSIRWYFSWLEWESDHPFSENLLKLSYNTYLVNLFGNLIGRLKGILKKNSYKTCEMEEFYTFEEELQQTLNQGEELLKNLKIFIKQIKIQQLLKQTVNLLESLNVLIEKYEPWKLEINSKKYKELHIVLYRQLAIISYIFSPIFEQKQWKIIQYELNLPIKSTSMIDYDFLLDLKNFQSKNLSPSTNIFPKYS